MVKPLDPALPEATPNPGLFSCIFCLGLFELYIFYVPPTEP